MYTATGVGQEPDEMKTTEVAAPLGQVASGEGEGEGEG